MIKKNNEEKVKANEEMLKREDDLSVVFNIIGKDAVISKKREQNNSSVLRLLGDWKEGETRQT